MDWYSLGVTLLIVATRDRAIQGSADNDWLDLCNNTPEEVPQFFLDWLKPVTYPQLRYEIKTLLRKGGVIFPDEPESESTSENGDAKVSQTNIPKIKIEDIPQIEQTSDMIINREQLGACCSSPGRACACAIM